MFGTRAIHRRNRTAGRECGGSLVEFCLGALFFFTIVGAVAFFALVIAHLAEPAEGWREWREHQRAVDSDQESGLEWYERRADVAQALRESRPLTCPLCGKELSLIATRLHRKNPGLPDSMGNCFLVHAKCKDEISRRLKWEPARRWRAALMQRRPSPDASP